MEMEAQSTTAVVISPRAFFFTETTPLIAVENPTGVDVETFLQVTNLETFGSLDKTILDSTNTFVLTITANNAATRFRRFQKDTSPSSQTDSSSAKGQNVIQRRPSRRQTFKTDGHPRKKRITWRVENNGPDINLANGPRSIICKGPRNSSRQKFRYFNKSDGRRNITGLVTRGRFVLAPHVAGQGDNIEAQVIEQTTKVRIEANQFFQYDGKNAQTGAKDVVKLQVISR